MDTGWWLVSTPLKHDGVRQLGVGMMTFPTEWKSKIHVPNHQADYHYIDVLFPPMIFFSLTNQSFVSDVFEMFSDSESEGFTA